MNINKVQFAGAPCGLHGSYTFYKGVKYTLNGKHKILALGEFVFLKIWEDEDIVSIGEVQLVWEDRVSSHMLVSLRLYFMPENTPEGRTEEHGEHEVISLSEKVVIRAEDLVTLLRTAADVKWTTGLRGIYGTRPSISTNNNNNNSTSYTNTTPTRAAAKPGDIIPAIGNIKLSPPSDASPPSDHVAATNNNAVLINIKTETPTSSNIDIKPEPDDHIKAEPGELDVKDIKDEKCLNNCVKTEAKCDAAKPAITAIPETLYYPPPVGGALDIKEIIREKKLIGDVIGCNTVHTIILSYDRYCRIRSIIKRVGAVEENMRSAVVQALGGFLVPSKNTLLLFCRDIFEYPELEGHDLLCNHLAPKLQGRPPKKHRKRSSNALNSTNNSDSDSSEETNTEDAKPKLKGKPGLNVPHKPGLHVPHKSGFAINKPNSLRALDRKSKPNTNTLVGGIHHGYALSRGSQSGTKANLRPKINLHHHHHNNTLTTPPPAPLPPAVVQSTTASSVGGGSSSLSSPTVTSTTAASKTRNNNNHNNTSPQSFLNSIQAQIKQGQQQGQQKQYDFSTPAVNRLIEVDFMSKLHTFMRDRNSPITRIPHIGYRQLNVFELFSKVQQLGGYEAVSAKKQWKLLYDQIAGPQSTPANSPNSSANLIRKHYERLLYPYEKFLLNEQKRLYGPDTATPAPRNTNTNSKQSEPSVSILQVPKISSVKKDNPIPADLAKRPEITITPIPRPINETLGGLAAAAAAAGNPLAGAFGPGFPSNACLKALGIDFHGLDLNMVDFNALSNLTDIAKKYKNSPAGAMASSGITCEPSAKRFKPDEGRLNGARGGRGGASDLQTELAKLQGVPDLVSADLLRSISMLDHNAKLLLPAHQSTKTISALAALLPQTSIFPAPAPAAHQQNSTRSPLKTAQNSSPRPEPPRVFQSQNLYAQGNRIYDKPIADAVTSSPKQNRENTKSSSPEIQILDLSRPPSFGSCSTPSSSGKNGKNYKSERLDVELLDLSTRRDITVSAVPKPSGKHSRLSSIPKVSIKASEGLTITPNHNSSSRSYRGGGTGSMNSASGIVGGGLGSLAGLSSAELTSLMAGMPGSALMAAAAAAAATQGLPQSLQGLPQALQGLPQALQGLPPGLASLGLAGVTGGAGSLPPGSLPASLLPFLMGTAAASSSKPSSNSYHSNPSSGGGGGGMPPPSMFPYLDPSTIAAYYNSLLPHSLLQQQQQQQNSLPSSLGASASMAAAQQAAALQMAQLNSLGLGGSLPGMGNLPSMSVTNNEALASLGMYKNFLGGAAAAGSNNNSGNMLVPPHFLAGLMSPGTKPKK